MKMSELQKEPPCPSKRSRTGFEVRWREVRKSIVIAHSIRHVVEICNVQRVMENLHEGIDAVESVRVLVDANKVHGGHMFLRHCNHCAIARFARWHRGISLWGPGMPCLTVAARHQGDHPRREQQDGRAAADHRLSGPLYLSLSALLLCDDE